MEKTKSKAGKSGISLFEKARIVNRSVENTEKAWKLVNAGLGLLSLLLKADDSELVSFARERILKGAERLCKNATTNGFGLCMLKENFIW